MKLGEAGKRMHDPKDFLASLFSQEKAKLNYTLSKKAKFNYTHKDLSDDSMCRAFFDFQEAVENIIVSEVKSHVFKYQKEMKEFTLHFRKLKFEAEEKVHRENMEREARQQAATASA